jgi:hypothetical protein
MAVTLNANSSTGFIATSDTSSILQLQTGGTTAVTVDASQNVGIGTASPGVRLEVSGASAASSFNALRMANTDTTASSPVTTLFQSADDGTLRNRATMTSGSDGSNNGYIALSTRSSGSITEKFRLNSTGALVLAGGSTSANGTGITFPATQSASSDANTLDDYEEGTFTPAFSRSGINVAYTSRNGFYTRVGRVVTLCCDLQLSTITAQGSGVLFLGALPFTGVVGQYSNVGVVNYNTVFDTVVVRTCWVYNNALAFNINTNNTSEYSGNVVASGYLSLTISYTLS